MIQKTAQVRADSYSHLFGSPYRNRSRRRLFLRFHELTYQRRNLICFGIEREVSRVEHVNVGIGYVLAVTFRLAQIERKIVLAPDNQ